MQEAVTPNCTGDIATIAPLRAATHYTTPGRSCVTDKHQTQQTLIRCLLHAPSTLEDRGWGLRTACMAIASAWLTRMAVVPLSRMAVVAVTFVVMPPTATLSNPTVQYLRAHHALCQFQDGGGDSFVCKLPKYTCCCSSVHHNAAQGTPGVEVMGCHCTVTRRSTQSLSSWRPLQATWHQNTACPGLVSWHTR